MQTEHLEVRKETLSDSLSWPPKNHSLAPFCVLLLHSHSLLWILDTKYVSFHLVTDPFAGHTSRNAASPSLNPNSLTISLHLQF